MNSQEIYQELKKLWDEFESAHNKETFRGEKTSKSFRDARKALGEIKKLVTPYRKASNDEQKAFDTERKASKA